MLAIANHEGQFTHKIDGESVNFHGAEIYVNADAIVVFGRQSGETMWNVDEVRVIYATDVDGDDLKLTAEEEKELAATIAWELGANTDIDERVHDYVKEIAYWERRR